MSTIYLPENLTYVAACNFTVAFQEHFNSDDLAIDFSRLRYSFPLAMLIVGGAIRQFVGNRKKAGLKTKAIGVSPTISVHSYLEHLGFFDFIGLRDRNPIGAARGSERYIPIRSITIEEFQLSGRDSKQVYDAIVDLSDDLAAVLAGAFKDYEVKRALTYALKETIRNVFEHSGADRCYVAGQRWADNSVEVAIVDEGKGILKSLSESFQLKTDAEALEYAIRPGVSRTTHLTHNEHDNSGFGLYVLSEVGRNFGRFVLGSGHCAMRQRPDKTARVDQVLFQGTFVGVRLSSAPKNFEGVLGDIISAGEEESLKLGSNTKASRSSRDIDSPRGNAP